MSVFTGSCCAKSLGFKSRGRKIRFASVTNGAESLRLGAWKGLCNIAERAPLQGFSLGTMGPSWPLSLFMFRVRIPIRSLLFFFFFFPWGCWLPVTWSGTQSKGLHLEPGVDVGQCWLTSLTVGLWGPLSSPSLADSTRIGFSSSQSGARKTRRKP